MLFNWKPILSKVFMTNTIVSEYVGKTANGNPVIGSLTIPSGIFLPLSSTRFLGLTIVSMTMNFIHGNTTIKSVSFLKTTHTTRFKTPLIRLCALLVLLVITTMKSTNQM